MRNAKKNTKAELESLRLPELQARFREVVGEITKSPNRKFLIRRIEEALAGQTTKEPAVVAESETANADPTIAAGPETTQPEPAEPPPEISQPTTVAEAAPPQPQLEFATPTDEEPKLPAYEPPADDTLPSAAAVKPARGRFSAMSLEELQAKYLAVVGRATGSDNRDYLIWKIREAEKGRITVGPRKQRESGTDADVKILPLRLETPVVEKMDAAWRELGIKTRMDFLRRAISHYLTHLGATEAAALFTPAE